MLETGLIGSLLGGLFRLAPELLKVFDRVNERKHELNMFKLQTDLEKVKGEFKVEEKYVDYSVAEMQAIAAANKSEGEVASNSYKWVSAAVALVRPSITYVIFLLYLTVKITFMANGLMQDNLPWKDVLAGVWTENDFGILMLIITFYFVGRPIEKYRK